MGYGDEIMGSGVARVNWEKFGLRTAFGNRQKVIWSPCAHHIYQNNPKVIGPNERYSAKDKFIWCEHYVGNRLYAANISGFWKWRYDFKPDVGEIFFTDLERDFSHKHKSGFIVIEPNVKSVSPNKQWLWERYQEVADCLLARGFQVVQFSGQKYLHRVERIATPSFRMAMSFLSKARLFIGPEGGLHHAAAIFRIPAVVIFGGFIHPKLTGYEYQASLFSGGDAACGTIRRPCAHCVQSMDEITTEQVIHAAEEQMNATRMVHGGGNTNWGADPEGNNSRPGLGERSGEGCDHPRSRLRGRVSGEMVD